MSNKRKSSALNEYRYVGKEIPQFIGKTNFFGIQCDEDQQKVVDAVWQRKKKLYMINSVAGSGKTLISTALGVLMFKYGIFDRIVYITFPGIYEKSQGYLPGDLLEKSEPYFQPLYNALITIGELPDHVCNTSFQAVENGTDYIECTVSTYMRGINISKSFVIIDEAENADLETLAKVLSRISDDCITLLIGHAGQCDMFDKSNSGFTACIDYNKKHNPEICESFELFTNHRGKVSQLADLMLAEYEKPAYGFIYMTRNKITGKLYIGQHKRSMNPEDIDDSWYLGSGVLLTRALAKYGKENFERTILYECQDLFMLNYMERVFIDYYNALEDDNFYNLVGGGGGILHLKFTEEQKEHMRKKRKPMSEEARKHMARNLSEEALARIGAAVKAKLTGYKHSDETRRKFSESHKGLKSIYKDGHYKYVRESTLEEYLSEGWVLRGAQTGKKSKKRKVWVNNVLEDRFIKEIDLDSYLQDGWTLGKFRGARKVTVGKDGVRHYIYEERLQKFIDDGWELIQSNKSLAEQNGASHYYPESRILCKILAKDDAGNIIKVYNTKEEFNESGLDFSKVFRVCIGSRQHYKDMCFELVVVDVNDRFTDGIRISKKSLKLNGFL